MWIKQMMNPASLNQLGERSPDPIPGCWKPGTSVSRCIIVIYNQY